MIDNEGMKIAEPSDEEIYNNEEIIKIQKKFPEKFWLEDLRELFGNGNYTKVIPTKNMTRIEILNALTRFYIYIIIIFLIIGSNKKNLLLPIIGLVVILCLYKINTNQNENETKELFTEAKYQAPTKSNPFMNVTTEDLMDNRTRLGAGPVTDPIVKNEIELSYEANGFTDIEDVFKRNHAQRQFYTTASTTIPNDQGAFADWVYRMPETCKENQLNCLKYEDVRFSRFSPYVGRMEKNNNDNV